ncbi:MAG TPA: hypothetical protein VII92_03780, partial [Anaerolineae bacterium]
PERSRRGTPPPLSRRLLPQFQRAAVKRDLAQGASQALFDGWCCQHSLSNIVQKNSVGRR